MSFFQNPFVDDFDGNWVLADRQHIPKWTVRGNAGRGKEIAYAWKQAPYDLSGNDSAGNSSAILNISFSLHGNNNWANLAIDVTAGAASAAAVTASEVAAALMANTVFAGYFSASIDYYKNGRDGQGIRLLITPKRPITEFRFYIINGQAEESIRFNARAGVAELPIFFARHTIDNRFAFPDSQGCLVLLDPSNSVDAAVIDNAVDAYGNSMGFDHGTVQADWQLLKGRSGIFNFQSITVDGSDRITQIIEYPAGAVVGDFARLIGYVYSGSNTHPSQITEIPYVLTSGDLVTP